jgi:hypothetical protein
MAKAKLPKVLIPTDNVWCAASYAFRVQNNKYIKRTDVEQSEDKTLKSNATIMNNVLLTPEMYTTEDKANALAMRRHFKGYISKLLAGTPLNGFSKQAMEIASKEDFDTTCYLELAIVASLPRVYDTDTQTQLRKDNRIAFANNHAPLGKEGDKVELNITVESYFYSQDFNIYFISAKADSGHSVKFTYRSALKAGEVLAVKGSIRNFESNDTICRLTRVKIIQQQEK